MEYAFPKYFKDGKTDPLPAYLAKAVEDLNSLLPRLREGDPGHGFLWDENLERKFEISPDHG